jgi:hypothetical protein
MVRRWLLRPKSGDRRVQRGNRSSYRKGTTLPSFQGIRKVSVPRRLRIRAVIAFASALIQRWCEQLFEWNSPFVLCR